MDSERVENKTVLAMQLRRYAQDARVPPAAYVAYIDGALLIQRGATRLLNAWAHEHFSAKSCDRDQISFARTVARFTARRSWSASGACFLAARRPQCDHPHTYCGNQTRHNQPRHNQTRLCHWRHGRSVASLHRMVFEPQPVPQRKRSIASMSQQEWKKLPASRQGRAIDAT